MSRATAEMIAAEIGSSAPAIRIGPNAQRSP
jgi:hypothetical protein